MKRTIAIIWLSMVAVILVGGFFLMDWKAASWFFGSMAFFGATIAAGIVLSED